MRCAWRRAARWVATLTALPAALPPRHASMRCSTSQSQPPPSPRSSPPQHQSAAQRAPRSRRCWSRAARVPAWALREALWPSSAASQKRSAATIPQDWRASTRACAPWTSHACSSRQPLRAHSYNTQALRPLFSLSWHKMLRRSGRSDRCCEPQQPLPPPSRPATHETMTSALAHHLPDGVRGSLCTAASRCFQLRWRLRFYTSRCFPWAFL